MSFHVPYLQVSLILLALFLQGCGTSSPAPVTDIGHASYTAKEYLVQKGDTLYSIAWRYDLDFRQLARANSISAPYLIMPGQHLALIESDVYQKNKPAGSSRSTVGRELAKENKQNDENDRNVSTKRVKKTAVEKKYPANSTDKGWLWPVSGKVVKAFSLRNDVNKGIDIAAAIGTPVVSSRSGHVVYAGSQLKGYGNLVIVRHDDTYLSAYAHNSRILVKEGQVVEQGQKIAEVGNTAAQRAKLHFEIRKQGKPINPLPLLQNNKYR